MLLREKLSVLFTFVFVNIPLGWLISLRFLIYVEVENSYELLYVALIYLGHISLLIFLLALPILAISLLLPKKAIFPLVVAWAGFWQLFLLVDTYIYALYRFHFSSFVFDMLINAGSDVFSFSLIMWLIAFAAVAIMAIIQIYLLKFAIKLQFSWLKSSLLFSIIFVAFLTQNAIHAWEDAHYRGEIPSFTPHFPLHMPLTASRFLKKKGLIDPQTARDDTEFKISSKKQRALNYPVSSVSCTPDKEPKNILLIAVDALRYDMLTADLMPNTMRFIDKTGAQVSKEHFSGGNSTQAGVFSLFYGLPVSYWNSFSSTKTPPMLLTSLQDQGYEIEVFTSASLVAPDFASNVFAGVEKLSLYTEGKTVWQQDETITRNFKSWINNSRSHPFFAFMFYNAAHSYSVPPNFPRIEPYLEHINYTALNNSYDPTAFFNRYKTSTQYVDSLLKEIYDELERLDLIKNTAVIITADHGESFNEQNKNYWGHGNSYAKEQVQVPFVIYLPDSNKTITDKRTFHADISVTLMEEVLGCKSEKFAYSLGFNLFEPFDRKWVFNGSYVGLAVLMDDYFVDVSPVGTHTSFDYNLTKIKSRKIPPDVASEVLDALSRYYK